MVSSHININIFFYKMLIGELVGKYSFLQWNIFRLNGNMNTSARYLAVFRSRPSSLLPPSDIFVVEAMTRDSKLIVSQHPSLQTYFSSSVYFYPLSFLPFEVPLSLKKVFFYFYWLMKLQQNEMIPKVFDFHSVAATNSANGNYFWVDTNLQDLPISISDAKYGNEIRIFLSSLNVANESVRRLINTLGELKISFDDSRTITRQYFDACIDFAKKEVNGNLLLSSLSSLVDVRDDTESILFITPERMISSSSNNILQEIIGQLGVDDVVFPPAVSLTYSFWKNFGIILEEYSLTTEDLYFLQQLVDILLRTNSKEGELLFSSYLSIKEEVINKYRLLPYPEEYQTAWKIVNLYF